MAKRRTHRAPKREYYQRAAQQYMRLYRVSEFDPLDVARWMCDTGLYTEKPKNKKVSFEDALLKVKQDQDTADDRFKEAFLKEKDRMKVIDQKFEEAMKRKDELEMPIKPIDLD